MALRKVRVLGFNGKDLRPDQILDALHDALSKELGPWSPKHFELANGKMKTAVNVGKPGRGKQVAKILEDLDFTASYRSVMAHANGTRQEINGKITVVSYSNLSGLVTVSTNL